MEQDDIRISLNVTGGEAFSRLHVGAVTYRMVSVDQANSAKALAQAMARSGASRGPILFKLEVQFGIHPEGVS